MSADGEARARVLAAGEASEPAVADRPVHAWFAAQARRTPDAPALVSGDEALSYAELDRRAARLARRLRARGVGPDVPVALYAPRSTALAVGVLGISRAGGACVPLDPAHPEARLAWILADTAAPVLVSADGLAARLPPHPAVVVDADADDDADAPEAAVDPGHLGYIIYTSGSTGRPKGIGLPHAALTNLVAWHDRTLLRAARTLQFASIGFDASFHEMYAAWASGGCVYLLGEAERRDVARLAGFLAAHAIEKAILPVVVLQQLAQDHPEALASLRELTTTGEQMHLTAPVIELFAGRLRGCALHNHYGPSETHVVTALTLAGPPPGWPPHPPIGRPIDGCVVRVLDERLRPCAVGEVGELYLGGVCLARGYWGRPDLTAERFVPDPWAAAPGERLYRTGDLARLREDGEFEYLGRRDDQVKIRGVRVEPGEIEAALGRHPQIREAAAVVREDRAGDRRVVAYVVARDARDEPALLAGLREFLRRSLLEAMIPAAFVPLRELPLTTNGKVDRRALPPPPEALHVAPRSEVEAALVDIWREVLRAGELGVHDDFFELGGHSLAATQVASRVRRLFGVEPTLEQLFVRPTIAAQAGWVRAQRSPRRADAPVVPVPRDRPLPLSPAQERMWFFHRLAPDSNAYSCPYFFRVRGPLDVAALQRALDALVARHEALRTSFHEAGGRPLQAIAATGRAPLEQADLGDLPAPEREARLRALLAAEVLRPFDLGRGPLLRAGVVRTAAAEHLLWLNIHHIAVDGWSMDVLLRELGALYAGQRRGEPAALPPLPLQFVDHAAWQREQLAGPGADEMLAWWTARLAGAPPLLRLPTDRPRPAVQRFRGGAVRVNLGPAPTAALRELGAAHGATLAMVVLAGLVALLHRYTGEDDLVVGVPIAGRDRVEIEGIVGLFVNTLAIRVDAAGDPSFAELLARVRKASLEAFDRDLVPFDRIVQELRPERALAHNPVVQVGFAPQPAGERDLTLAGLAVETLDVDAQKTIFDLTLYTWEERGALAGTLEYSADLFDRASIERMREHLLALLVGACEAQAAPASRVPLVDARAREALLRRGLGPPAPTGPELALHELFAAQVARGPERRAVLWGGVATSYAALARRAGALAGLLRARGVGPEVRVALALERSLELIVAVLAVLQAGGAFVPVDPAYPAERLAYMLADCRAEVVLTTARLAARLPEHAAVIRVDEGPIDVRPPPPVRVDPAHPAYVIYTSGSTGAPKGVVVPHAGAVHLARAHQQALELAEDDVVLQFASPSFDAFVWELLMAWSAGAALCPLPPGTPVPGREFVELLRAARVSVALLPPSLLAVLPEGGLPALRRVIAGGEVCPAEVVDRWAPGRRFFNAYGPTEITVVATIARCEPGRGAPGIGVPLPGVRALVLDRHGEPCPVGVPGELHVGGPGVARGYLGRPALTAERFVPDPCAGAPGDRLYRTGDRARWGADGALEFLGRLDEQVKLRGFRVELGEVEAALRAHSDVLDVAAVVHEGAIVAYVVPTATGVSDETRAAEVEAWRALYDDTYAHPSAGAEFDTTGWVSSFTGLPLPAARMQEWQAATVARVRRLRPARVWELGCGTGLLTLPLAPETAAYLGTDLSDVAVARLRGQVEDRGLAHVTIARRVADDFRGLERARFDLVMLHSVVQYFPDLDYLGRVLAGAVAHVDAGGVVLVGDVRSLPLLPAFHAAVQLAQAPADAPVARVRERAARAVEREHELVLDPACFTALAAKLPRVSRAEVWLRRGRGDDEMTRFRVDALLFVEVDAPVAAVEATWPWGQVDDLPSLARRLADVEVVEVVDIPSARVAAAVAAARRLGGEGTAKALADAAAAEALGAVEPEDLWALGERLGFEVRLTPARSGDPAAVDALFERGADPTRPTAWPRAAAPVDPRRPLADDPLRARLARGLVPALRSFVADKLPAHMLPAAIALVDALPRAPGGKVDRRALAERAPAAASSGAAYVHPRSAIEQTLAEIWREVLGLDRVGIDDPFFELGGHSLLLAQVRAAISARLGREPAMVELFQHPTIRRLAAHLAAEPAPAPAAAAVVAPAADAVAIVGMAGRFPGAGDVEALWSLLLAGGEGVVRSGEAELAAAGVDPALIASPRFVPAFGALEGAFDFDAAFFGYGPAEARMIDPQQRVFLECAHAALEDAAVDPARAVVGVFAGSDAPRYWLRRVDPSGADPFQASVANVPDNLTTRAAFKLGLRGPAVTVLTACSTSLVAVHMACQSLRAGECEVAIAGGAAVAPPEVLGHVYEEGGILSPDGRCRPFDRDAAGTVSASGVAAVVLKRLADAVADGDEIRAVIRGSAIGNDGADKIGFTAPGVRGQAEVIARAQAAAGVDPDGVDLIEAHGTATPLGDPIEVQALTRAFRARTDRRNFCALGSVKGNLGHLGAAAGVTGLIKATLALGRGQIPRTLHFRAPNPALELESSPFFVPADTIAWPRRHGPRRAGVSAFGVGGTNAHVVLEEAPPRPPAEPAGPWQLLPLSARTPQALAEQARRLAEHLRARPGLALADVAHTLQRRPALAPERRVVVARDVEGAAQALTDPRPAGGAAGRVRAPRLAFVFPGVATQHRGLARELYAGEPVFRAALDEVAARLSAELGEDVRALLLADDEDAARRLLAPSRNMAAVFAVEHALTRLLLAWGLRPAAALGHSLGEYAAASLAGVMDLGDAAALVVARGRLCDEVPGVAMLSVARAPASASAWLPEGLAIAAVNAADACVVTGPVDAVERLAAALTQAGVHARRLPISLASHSPWMDPLVPRLVERAARADLRPPTLTMISSVTGEPLGDAAADPRHWGDHLRRTVRFDAALATLLADPAVAVVEVGPGGQLAGLVRRHPAAGPERVVVSAMPHPQAGLGELEALRLAVGRLWCAGVDLDWDAVAGGARRRKLSLPTYPFARTRHLLAAPRPTRAATGAAEPGPEPAAGPPPGDRAAPADPVARALAEIWSEVLGVDAVGLDDNFFALGGSSLLAIQLRARIRERLGVAAPVHALVEAPTIRGLAGRLRPDAPEARPGLLVRLQPGAAAVPPLFLVQPVGGTVYTYLPLARRLAWPGAVHGLRASGMDPGEPVLDDAREIVARFLEEVVRARPTGVVLLGGHSAGGVLAHELARALEARGRETAVVMIDAPSPPAIRRQAIRSADDVLRELGSFATASSPAYQALVTALGDGSPLGAVVLATWQALQRCEPRPIRGELVYVAAAEQRDARDARAGAWWMDLGEGAFSLHRSPGDHFTMMDEPQVQPLARLIRRALADWLPRPADE